MEVILLDKVKNKSVGDCISLLDILKSTESISVGMFSNVDKIHWDR